MADRPEGFVPHHPLARCWECPLYSGPGYVPTSDGPGTVAIVGQAPSWNELRAGAPFVGASGELLASMISRAGAGKLLAPSIVSNAVSCVAPDDKVPAKAVACCAPRLQAELEGAAEILALGKVAAQAVTGWSPKITDSPLVARDQWHKRRVVVGPHPAAVLRAPAWGPKLQGAIERLATADVSVTWEWPPYEVARDEYESVKLLDDWKWLHQGPLVIDLEWPEDAATKWDRFDVARLRCMGLGREDGTIAVLGEQALRSPLVRNTLDAFLLAVGVEGHNVKGDVGVLARKGIRSRLVGDTMMAEAVLDETPGGRGLESIASRRLGLPDWKPADSSWYTTSSDDDLHRYQAQDIAATREAKAYYQRAGAWEHTLHRDLLVPACAMLQRVEDRGMGIDDARMELVLNTYLEGLPAARAAVVAAFDGTLAEDINPGSWQQILAAFANVGFPLPSTDAKKVLLPLLADPGTPEPVRETIEKLLAWRKLNTQLTRYLIPLSELETRDHRVHAEFNPIGTETGRLSSARPNMQNWPRPHVGEGGLGDARSIFTAGPGRVYVAVDLSQAELRVIGVESAPYGGQMLEVCNSGRDLHEETASRSGLLRVTAKFLNFGLSYGLSVWGIQQGLNCSEVEALAIYNRYRQAFPDVIGWQDAIKANARAGVPITTVFGRTRRPLDFSLLDDYQQAAQEREMMAAKPQAVVSDITLTAAIEADKLGVEVVSLVHDEIRAECDTAQADEVVAILTEQVRLAGLRYTDRVAFPVDSKVTTHWT